MASKISIISVGKTRERYILEGISEYEKRLRPFCKIELIELKDEGIKRESEKLMARIDEGAFVLDANGQQLISEEFADLIKRQEKDIVFIIGGHEGITEDVKRKAKLISLSRMTFLHEMCKLFLMEQIYRAFMIINKRGYYHK